MSQVQIKIKDVLAHLENGLTREEIAEHYGITMADCKRLFMHPELKGKKTKTKPGFVIVEDEVEEEVSTETISDTTTEEIEETVAEVESTEETAQEEASPVMEDVETTPVKPLWS